LVFFGGTPDTYQKAGPERGDRHLNFHDYRDNLPLSVRA
jgi:hypothetical protein